MMRLLKSMDKLAKEGNLFRCFFGPPRNPSIELLSRLKWYDGTVKPYPYSSVTQSKDEQHELSLQLTTTTTTNTNTSPSSNSSSKSEKHHEILW